MVSEQSSERNEAMDRRHAPTEDVTNEDLLSSALAENGQSSRIGNRATPCIRGCPSASSDFFNYPTTSNAMQYVRITSFGGGFNGRLMTRHVAPDNSCLFSSIRFVLSDKIEPQSNDMLRRTVARLIASDPNFYNEAMLGRSNSEYCDWIQRSDSWGGAIEVSVFSNYYRIEIDVVDMQNGIINRFGEDKNYALRVFIKFDGAHYDPLYMAMEGSAEPATIFPIAENYVYLQAEQLARDSKAARDYYKNLQKYKIYCRDCNGKFVGVEEAEQHTAATGHVNFKQI